jgi:TRAP-type C4-dicarboxylate transport system permease small subunit
VSVTFLAERVPTRVMAGVSLVLNGVALIFLAQLGLQGTHLTIQSHHLETITLPIPWSAIYIAAPVSALLMILETIRLIWLGPIPAAKTEASI